MGEASSEAAGTSAPPQLHRKLGILNAASINMSNMIGIGPFITVPPILATLGGPQSLGGAGNAPAHDFF
jgi:hypothetical protein